MMPAQFTASPLLRSHSRRTYAAVLLLALAASCAKNKTQSDDFYVRADPIPVRVYNENFLDMNVSVVASGVSRRLGLVSGNSSAEFKIAGSVANGQGISLLAVPIGGRGNAATGNLNVSPGQIIEFKIGSVLRQSTATVHDP